MADVHAGPLSLIGLEDELTCSICLSPFDCPVTIPCGHNFCQGCLLAAWKDSSSCPQCRTHFATRPELKKNTVLSSVVQSFTLRKSESQAPPRAEQQQQEEEEDDDVVRCDACMEAEASQTCLTCMASYCEEHLRPHRDNPAFRLHQLSRPLGDLSERICPDHHKLMELFCSQHSRPICSLCLQQVHKGCPFISPEERRNLTELGLKHQLRLLGGNMEKTEAVLFQINDTQSKIQDTATRRKTALTTVYQQIRDMLDQEQRRAQRDVDRELDACQMTVQDRVKKLTYDTDKMTEAKEEIHSLLSQSQSFAFLQASFDFNAAKFKDASAPRLTLDSKSVTATQAFSALLKEHLTEMLKQPVEARLLLLRPELNPGFVAAVAEAPRQGRQPRSHSPAPPLLHSAPPLLQLPPGPLYPFMGSQAACNPPRFMQGAYPGPPFTTGRKTKPNRRPPSPSPAGRTMPGTKRFDPNQYDYPRR